MASNLIFQIAGDSTSRDHTPSSIGEYDDNDSFIDDGEDEDAPGSPLEPVRSNSPGLFCTPEPARELPIRPSGVDGRRGATLDAWLDRTADSALQRGERVLPSLELRDLSVTPVLGSVHELRSHLSGGSSRLPSLSVGSARPPTVIPKRRRGGPRAGGGKRKRVVESCTPSVDGESSRRPSVAQTDSSEEVPLRQLKHRRLSDASRSVSSAASRRSTFSVASS